MLELCVGSQLLLLDNNSDAAQHQPCRALKKTNKQHPYFEFIRAIVHKKGKHMEDLLVIKV